MGKGDQQHWRSFSECNSFDWAPIRELPEPPWRKEGFGNWGSLPEVAILFTRLPRRLTPQEEVPQGILGAVVSAPPQVLACSLSWHGRPTFLFFLSSCSGVFLFVVHSVSGFVSFCLSFSSSLLFSTSFCVQLYFLLTSRPLLRDFSSHPKITRECPIWLHSGGIFLPSRTC